MQKAKPVPLLQQIREVYLQVLPRNSLHITNATIAIVDDSKGFTLLELIIVVAISFIIGITAVPFYSNFFTQNAVSNSTDQLVAELRKAQIYSITGKQGGSWGVNYNYTNGTGTITLFKGASYATRTTAFDENFFVYSPATVSGFTTVTYMHATGTPSAVQTITVLDNNNSHLVTVNALGVVNK